MIENHILKLIVGPMPLDQEQFENKQKDYREGLLDEYQCLIYIPIGKDKTKPVFSYLKVKDIKKFMYEIYSDELFSMIDVEEFVRKEVEQKGIVVIDEIDKLVRTVPI